MGMGLDPEANDVPMGVNVIGLPVTSGGARVCPEGLLVLPFGGADGER